MNSKLLLLLAAWIYLLPVSNTAFALPNDSPFPDHINTDYHIFGDVIDYPGVISWCEDYVNRKERWTRFQGCEASPGSVANVGCTAYIRSSTTIAPVCKLEFRCLIQQGPNAGEYALDTAPDISNPYCPGSTSRSKNLGECNGCPAPKAGNPIHTGTGNKFQVEMDYQSANPNSNLSFRRYYNSQAQRILRFGPGWSGDFLQRIRPYPEFGIVYAIRPDGKEYYFYQSGEDWIGDPDVPVQLEEQRDIQGNTTGWQLYLPDDSRESYAVTQYGIGYPVVITRRNGLATRLYYDIGTQQGGDNNATTLDQVVGPFGRTLRFEYGSNNMISRFIDPSGNDIRYQYDESGRLAVVNYPDANSGRSEDGPARLYHYENLQYPNALTGITNENGQRYVNWGYDNSGRAIYSEYAGGVDRVDINYNADGSTTVINALGLTLTYEFVTIHGVVKVAHIDGGPCANCDTTQTVTYDENGYPASRTDYRGTMTLYEHNERGLETSRIEAAGTDLEHTINTQWHPDFRLPVMISVPGRVTTFIYDHRGLLLERIERAAQ